MEFSIILIKVLMILILLCAESSGRFVHKIEDHNLPMPKEVSQCRKGCFMKFLNHPFNKSNHDECSLTPNCFMCWDYCLMLHKDRNKKVITTLMCTDGICFAGCKFACNYYRYLLAIQVLGNGREFFH